MKGLVCLATLATLAWSSAVSAQSAPGARPSAATAPAATTAADTPAPERPTASTAGTPGPETPEEKATSLPGGDTRSGREIFRRFREGLSDPGCGEGVPARWRSHFAHVPKQFEGVAGSELLPLFGYVVDALREAHLPTEFALIPFVESGYRPGARSASGPAGLWQFMARTARDHEIPVSPTYDGRLSPVASTRAAVRYLKTLHGMFAGDWRLAVMAFNAGEYRVLAALKRHGQRADAATPVALGSLTGITQAYVGKLHALSCLLAEAEDDRRWLQAIDRPVARLTAVALPPGTVDLDRWARTEGLDAGRVARLNPALAAGRMADVPGLRVLAQATGPRPPVSVDDAVPPPADDASRTATVPPTRPPGDAPMAEPSEPHRDARTHDASGPPGDMRTHVVKRGESAWTIARLHGIPLARLLARNALSAGATLRPGMLLSLDARPSEPAMSN